MIYIYIQYPKTNNNKVTWFEKIQYFIYSIPSIKKIERYLNKINLKDEEKRFNEKSTIYLIIELLNLYYKRFDFPVFKVFYLFEKVF